MDALLAFPRTGSYEEPLSPTTQVHRVWPHSLPTHFPSKISGLRPYGDIREDVVANTLRSDPKNQGDFSDSENLLETSDEDRLKSFD